MRHQPEAVGEHEGKPGHEGDAAWRERQRLKRARSRASWPWTLGLGVVALGWGAWTRLQWQSRQHPVTLRVVRQAAPNDGPREPFLDIVMPDAPRSSDEHNIEGPIWSGRISSAQFRAAPDQPWRELPPEAREGIEKSLFAQPRSQRESNGVRARWLKQQGWFPPVGSEHKIQAEVQAEFMDDNEHHWSGSAQTSLDIVVPTPTMPPPTKVIAGIQKIQYAPGLVTSKRSPNAQGGQVNAGLWRDLPAPGQKGFPVIVPSGEFVSLRVVQKGRAPGDEASFAPLKPRWLEPGRGSDFWTPGLEDHYLPILDAGAPAEGVYKRIEVKAEAEDSEVVRGVAPGEVRAGDKSYAVAWVLVRPKSAAGLPIPTFDAAASTSENDARP